MKKILYFILAILLCFLMASCDNNEKIDLWDSAIYTEDTSFGNGEKTLEVEVEAEGKSVTFTIKTDKETVGEALSEHNLIDGDKGAYGLYVKVVNGIRAEYSENQSYWSFNKDGEYMSTGVDVTKFKDKEHYELVYTK